MFFLQFQFTFYKSSFTLISRNMAQIKNCSAYTRTIFGLFLLEIPACCICSHQGWQWALRTNQKRGPSSDIVDFPINSGVNKLIFLQSTKIKLEMCFFVLIFFVVVFVFYYTFLVKDRKPEGDKQQLLDLSIPLHAPEKVPSCKTISLQ